MTQVKGINPGRLKHRVMIMRYQAAEDELGNTVHELVPLKKCWAEIRPVRGKEQLEYYKNVNDLMYKVTIRYTDDHGEGCGPLQWQTVPDQLHYKSS